MTSDLVLTREPDRTLVRVGNLDLADLDAVADGELRILDVVAATELRFARPRKIRELIARTWPDPAAGPYRRTTLSGSEYWLTEAELLRVISRSRTPVAKAAADGLIERFGAAGRARRGAGAAVGAQGENGGNGGENEDVREVPQVGAGAEEQGLVVAPQVGALTVRGAGAEGVGAPGTLAADPRWSRIEGLLRGVRPRLAAATIARVGASLVAPLPDLSWPLLQGLARLYQRHLDVAERDDLAR